jgi:iron complex transport system permease protein
VVAVTGPIGFVGLLVPHAARAMLGPGHRLLLPASLVLGGGFLVLADGVARSVSVLGRGSELPVGVLTALIGGPLFLVVLLRGRNRG